MWWSDTVCWNVAWSGRIKLSKVSHIFSVSVRKFPFRWNEYVHCNINWWVANFKKSILSKYLHYQYNEIHVSIYFVSSTLLWRWLCCFPTVSRPFPTVTTRSILTRHIAITPLYHPITSHTATPHPPSLFSEHLPENRRYTVQTSMWVLL